MSETVTLKDQAGRYEIVKTRSEGRESYVRSVATGRYKWILTESIQTKSED